VLGRSGGIEASPNVTSKGNEAKPLQTHRKTFDHGKGILIEITMTEPGSIQVYTSVPESEDYDVGNIMRELTNKAHFADFVISDEEQKVLAKAFAELREMNDLPPAPFRLFRDEVMDLVSHGVSPSIVLGILVLLDKDS